jgi:ribonuclease BN (tRNA processing enzyme)
MSSYFVRNGAGRSLAASDLVPLFYRKSRALMPGVRYPERDEDVNCSGGSFEPGVAVKVTVVPSAFGDSPSYQYLTSILINDKVAFDAGSIGYYKGSEDQAAITHIFLSHSHIDHVGSLPIFLDNVAGLNEKPVVVLASEAVEDCLRRDLFAGRLWPDYLALTNDGKPFLTLETLRSGQPVEVHGLRVTPVWVSHAVPTMGFVVEEPASAVLIVSDTGPTEEIWRVAARVTNLKAVFLETSWPNEEKRLAEVSRHLTPAMFLSEMKKLDRDVPFFAVHIKPRYREQVEQQLLASGNMNARIAQLGATYEF